MEVEQGQAAGKEPANMLPMPTDTPCRHEMPQRGLGATMPPVPGRRPPGQGLQTAMDGAKIEAARTKPAGGDESTAERPATIPDASDLY